MHYFYIVKLCIIAQFHNILPRFTFSDQFFLISTYDRVVTDARSDGQTKNQALFVQFIVFVFYRLILPIIK